jgi:hypothetical protein
LSLNLFESTPLSELLNQPDECDRPELSEPQISLFPEISGQ